MWSILWKSAERYGIAAVLCGVLLYWNRLDRNELTDRLDQQRDRVTEQQEFIQEKLLLTIENNTKALEHVYTTFPVIK